MLSKSAIIRQKRYEKIYQSHADDIYRICLHFLKDEKRAKDATEKVFVEFYKEFHEVDSDHIFAYLVFMAKRLSSGEQVHNLASGEVTECIASGKK